MFFQIILKEKMSNLIILYIILFFKKINNSFL